MNNIIEINQHTIIIDGGDPLEGCPKSYDEAHKWEDEVNRNKDKNHEPSWAFDCGFKLDFDGPILDVSSRFYPPKTHYGAKWDGIVNILLLGKKIIKKEFECDTLDQLRNEVETYLKDIIKKI